MNGNLYYGWNDGFLYKRTFDGTTIGAQTAIPLNGLDVQPPSTFTIPGTTTRVPALTTDIAAMTGMFYDNQRIYYTVSKTGSASANNNKLYYRYFNPESEVIGASLFVASTGGEGVNWGNVRGMTLASGKLIYALTDGRLYSVNWDGTKPTGPVHSGQLRDHLAITRTVRLQPGQRTRSRRPNPASRAARARRSTLSDLSWGASTDNFAGPLTYRVYRDAVQSIR